MQHQRSAVLILATAVALLVSTERDRSSDRAAVRSGPRVECVSAREDGPFAPERSLEAARRALRRQTLTNQGGTIHLTPRNYVVDQVANAGPGAPKGTRRRHYFRLVRAQCGHLQAERTWLVSVILTQAQLPLPPLDLLVTRTSEGWRVVYQSYSTS